MLISLRYSLQSLLRHRQTTLAAASGIALLVFVLAASRMLAAGLDATMQRAGRADHALVMQVDAWSESGSRIRGSAFELAAGAPGVRRDAGGIPRAAPESVAQVFLSRKNHPSDYTSIQVRGVKGASFALRPYVRVVEGRAARPGSSEAIVGRGVVGRYAGLALGERFALQKSRDFTVVGVFEADQTAYESEVWVDLDSMRSALNWQGYLSSITVELESERDFPAFARALKSDKLAGLAVTRERDYYEKVSSGMARLIRGVGSMVGFTFSFGAALGAAITMYGAVSERRRELGFLSALGFRRRAVLCAILFEALVIALLGGVLGMFLAWLTRFIHFATMNYATGQLLAFPFLPSFGILASALAGGVLVGVAGGLFPAWRAAAADPVSAMRA
jgi:putative ABC transport system permease protein